MGLNQQDVRSIIGTIRSLCTQLRPTLGRTPQPRTSSEERCRMLRVTHKAARGAASVLHATGLLGHAAECAMRGGQLAVASLLHKDLATKLRRRESDAIEALEDGHDIYADANVAEARLAQPVLAAFAERIRELLADWPENPILEQLLKIITRVLSFPLSSPILKITTGLELLLRKGYDWEAVAHKGVSIVGHLDTTRGLVARWRRMELDAWKHILDTRDRGAQHKAQKWWFHLFELTRKVWLGSLHSLRAPGTTDTTRISLHLQHSAAQRCTLHCTTPSLPLSLAVAGRRACSGRGLRGGPGPKGAPGCLPPGALSALPLPPFPAGG